MSRGTSLLPVLIGVNRLCDRGADRNADPIRYLEHVVREALHDAGIPDQASSIDGLYVTQVLSRSYNDEVTELRDRLGCSSARLLYTPTGACAPQSLLAHACDRIASGDSALAVICSAEAFRKQPAIDWAEKTFHPYSESRIELHGEVTPHASRCEVAYGVHEPMVAYSLFANAFARMMGWTTAEYVRRAATLCSAMSRKAQANPYAWSNSSYTPQEIETPCQRNRQITIPFTKFMMSRIDVNQAAAIVVIREDLADRLGVPEDRRVFLTGASERTDTSRLTHRRSLHESPIAGRSIRDAIAAAGLTPGDVTHWDLYSCFPAAPQITMHGAELSLDCPTMIGGLPYYGGPGNHYSLHAACEAIELLRQRVVANVVVQGLCWNLHRSAVNVYSHQRPERMPTYHDDGKHTAVPPQRPFEERAHGDYTVESFTTLFTRDGQPYRTVFTATDSRGVRVLAMSCDPGVMQETTITSLIGRCATIEFAPHDSVNRVKTLR